MSVQTGTVYNNHFINKNFQGILLPLRCLKHLWFISSFTIVKNCIRNHSVYYHIVSLLIILGITAYNLYFVSTSLTPKQFAFVGFVNKVYYCLMLIFGLPIFKYNIYNKRKFYIEMLINIQNAFRIINYKNYKMFEIRNWISVLCDIFLFFINVSLLRRLSPLTYALVYIDVHITYGIQIIKLIRDGMKTWIAEVESYCEHCLDLEEDILNNTLKKLLKAYMELMKAFDVFKKVFQFTIFYYVVVSTFIYVLLCLHISIEIEQQHEMRYDRSEIILNEIANNLWIFKRILGIIMFSSNCEKLYMTIRQIDETCNFLLLKNTQKTVAIKRLCRNVQRLNCAAFHKMTACHIFTVDGRLPQEFGAVLLEYLFVVLQFSLKIDKIMK